MDLKTFQYIPPWEWPEDAGKMFLKILRDDQADASYRLRSHGHGRDAFGRRKR